MSDLPRNGRGTPASSQGRLAGGARQQGAAVRGRLRVYLGVAPGAGATCMLLREGHERAASGADVVVASVATRGRPGTARLLAGLEVIPPAAVAPGDTVAGRLDLDAVLARNPQVALVDELAHRNPRDSGHACRWHDAAELLAAGWCGTGPLSALRQLTLRWLAATLNQHRQRSGPAGHGYHIEPAGERVVVALPGGPEGQTLIRRAARIALRCGADLLAVHITRPGGRAAALPAGLVAQRQLTESLGGTYHQLTSRDIAAALLTFVRTNNATQLVLGTGHRSRLSALRPKSRIISGVIRGATGTDVHVITTRTPSTICPDSTHIQPERTPPRSRVRDAFWPAAG